MGAGKGPARRMSVVAITLQHLPPGGHEGGKEGETKNCRRDGKVAGVVFKWVPGSTFPSKPLWEKINSEAVEVRFDKSLFNDDTALVGTQRSCKREWR